MSPLLVIVGGLCWAAVALVLAFGVPQPNPLLPVGAAFMAGWVIRAAFDSGTFR